MKKRLPDTFRQSEVKRKGRKTEEQTRQEANNEIEARTAHLKTWLGDDPDVTI